MWIVVVNRVEHLFHNQEEAYRFHHNTPNPLKNRICSLEFYIKMLELDKQSSSFGIKHIEKNNQIEQRWLEYRGLVKALTRINSKLESLDEKRKVGSSSNN